MMKCRISGCTLVLHKVTKVCRLGCPWSELSAFPEMFDFDAMEDVEHSHVPYGAQADEFRRLSYALVVILLKAAEIWRKTSMDELPSTSEQKREYRSVIQQLRRTERKTAAEASTSHLISSIHALLLGGKL